MVDTERYYYSDATYELELNLHNVRRELISMLEVYEENDCSDCFQIKCKCAKGPKTTSKTSNSGNSHSSMEEPDWKKEFPDPEPPRTEDESAGPSTPEQEENKEKESVIKNIEAWIEASSKAAVKETKSVAVNLKESFLQVGKEKKDKERMEKEKKEKEKEKNNLVTHANAVEAFFKYFKVPPTSTNVSYVSSKLAAAWTNPTGRSYTYF